MRICVVGLGRIGMPVAVQFAGKGIRVIGYDTNPAVVAAANASSCPFADEEGLAARLATAVQEGLLTATTDAAQAVHGSDVVTIVVPLLVDGQNVPDFRHLDAAAKAVAEALKPGTLVILETTVPVGTTRDRLGPLLETSGLTMGRDFFLAFSPERVSPGRIFSDLSRYPKIVGGIDNESGQRASEFYSTALDAPVTLVRDAETAELVKLAEATYRDLNIAFANELAISADALGLDISEVISAANSQPYSHVHEPGVGVGGRCLPVYPYFMTSQLSATSLVAAARNINDGMAEYAVQKLERALGSLEGVRVLILGLSYRPNLKEASHSSALLLDQSLRKRGAEVLIHDPFFTSREMAELGLTATDLEPPPRVDALIVQSYHDEYRCLDLKVFQPRVVLDGRNALDKAMLESQGILYLGVGR